MVSIIWWNLRVQEIEKISQFKRLENGNRIAKDHTLIETTEQGKNTNERAAREKEKKSIF